MQVIGEVGITLWKSPYGDYPTYGNYPMGITVYGYYPYTMQCQKPRTPANGRLILLAQLVEQGADVVANETGKQIDGVDFQYCIGGFVSYVGTY